MSSFMIGTATYVKDGVKYTVGDLCEQDGWIMEQLIKTYGEENVEWTPHGWNR